MILDSSAFIAFLKLSDSHNSESTNAIQTKRTVESLFIHEVSLAECLVHAQSEQEAQSILAVATSLRIGIADSRGSEGALRVSKIRKKTGLYLPDCYVFDAAIENSESLLAFDKKMNKWARQLGIITLVN